MRCYMICHHVTKSLGQMTVCFNTLGSTTADVNTYTFAAGVAFWATALDAGFGVNFLLGGDISSVNNTCV